MFDNLVLNTDSYKASHWLQYPPATTGAFSYVESRGGRYDRTVFFGLQAILKSQLAKPVTHAMIDEAAALLAAHGEPFNEAGWRRIVDVHGGRLPVRIRAVPEGTVVPTHQALMTIENTDPECYWLPSYLETLLLRVWYPVTVATISWHVKQTIKATLEKTSDNAATELPFKLHDFGARGVSSQESAALGGLAHLVNFMGSDTLSAVLAGRAWYNEPMAAFSIPAAEHSTVTSWGRPNEVEAYRNMLARFGKPGALFSVVSDSYDLFHAVRTLWGGELKQAVIDSGATLVVRPDSGDPVTVVAETLKILDETFGSTINGKGYKVLNHVRVIQGDGVNPTSIAAILDRIVADGFSAENLAFGMGGGLLQQLDRDTQKFALKCSAAKVDGQWIDVSKNPATDPGKRSKAGRLALLVDGAGTYRTVALAEGQAIEPGWRDAMATVWENGQLLVDQTLAQVRARSEG
uniref:nicotinate phosphoribosyltransferase n=1 Tax=uncultured Caulobacter sp. TaxID=158749 RepID=UPI0025FFF676|nr:nicotinate phosphoribosyltransferase [uncultured Caulobacter sp.]